MTRTIHMPAAVITLVFGITATSQPGASPQFSDWAVPANLGATINLAFTAMGPSNDFGPAVSRDGLSLYFTSDRLGGFGAQDLWVSERQTKDDPWGTPVNLGPVINTGASENVPALSRDGHWLFFNSDRIGGFGLQDIWASWREHTNDNFGWEAPFNLGAGVNTAFADVNASYVENEEGGAPLLYFTSNRPGGAGGFDVYVSQLGPTGTFDPATLVADLSSADKNEQRPSVRFDGLEVFFHAIPIAPGFSNDLWVSSRESALDPWSEPVPLGPGVNTAYADQQPYIAADRTTLYLTSNRPGGFGGLDLYVSTRTKHGR